MAKREVAEYCSECENEVILQWDTEIDGFEITCPYCGAKLMLCDECQHTICEDGEAHNCDWDDACGECHRCKSRIAKREEQEQKDFERRLLQKKTHELYKLYWCMTHGITIDEISRMADQWAENLGGGAEDYAPFRNYLEANGFFGSNIWSCRSEFVDCEYRDVSLMKSLLDPADFEKYLELEGEEHPDILGDTIKVETPHGTIVAKDQNDPDYPGISLFFVPKGTELEHAGCIMEFNPTYHPNDAWGADETIPSVNLRIYERENPFDGPQQVLVMEPLSEATTNNA